MGAEGWHFAIILYAILFYSVVLYGVVLYHVRLRGLPGGLGSAMRPP